MKRFFLGLIGTWFVGAHLTDAAPDPKVEMTVQLPPFIVEQPAGPRWRYLQIPRFEILSRCSDLTTNELALLFHRANQMLSLVLPEKFQVAMDVPQTVILYDQRLWPAAERAAVAAMLKENALNANGRALVLPRALLEPGPPGRAAGGAEEAFLSNLMLPDADSITTFVLVPDSAIDPQEWYLTPEYVSNLLESRTPALPVWFKVGFMRLYRSLQFRDLTVSVRVDRWGGNNGKSAAGPELLPLSAFLTGAAGPADNPDGWSTQGEMLVRWGLDPEGGHQEGFWRFLDRACSEPPTEKLFRECLGLDFRAAEEQLRRPAGTARTMRWTLPEESARLHAASRDASSREVARIKGEWERLEVRYVRRNQPELEGDYLKLARHTLGRAYDRGDHDPRLRASLGLLESEAGNTAEAKGHLEAAVQAGVVRPRAYFELARLRYNQLVGRSTRDDGKFRADQVDSVVQPLLAGMQQAPRLPAAYELLAHITSLAIDPPAPEVTAALTEGARLFPAKRDGLLNFRVEP